MARWMGWEHYKVPMLPEGVCGDAEVDRFIITEKASKFENMRMAFNPGMGHRRFVPGTFTRLKVNGSCMMSDTPAEIRDHMELFQAAKGKVLIHGLGLGMCVSGCLVDGDVDSVTVVEKNKNVIKLVGEFWKEKFSDRLTIIHDDALTMTWPKGTHFDAVWHDIWMDICANNWPEYKRLSRRWARRCDWQGAWVKYLVQTHAKREI